MVMEAREFRVVVAAADFDVTTGFYERVLQLRRIRAWDGDGGRGVLLSAGGNAVVEVLEASTGGSGVPAHRGTWLALEVDDVDAWYDRVLEAGGAVQGRPHDMPWGHRTFTVLDPDGMMVALYEVVAVSQRS